jgi:nucleobase:cation symporter-1, NCS1 family
MANDEAGGDGVIRDVPGRRRATYTPPARRTNPPSEAVKAGTDTASAESADSRQDDDALASAMEREVASLAAATPVAPAKETPARSTLSDDDLVQMIDADLASSGATLGAIQKLEGLLAARSAPVQSAAGDAQPDSAADLHPGAHRASAPPDEPTFSNWIAPAAFLADPSYDDPRYVPAARHRDDHVPVDLPADLPAEVSHAAQTEADELAVPAETAEPVEDEGTAESVARPDTAQAGGEPAADSAMIPLALASVPVAVMQSVATGSHPVIDSGYDDDVVDDADDLTVPFEAVLAPVASPRVPSDEDVLFDAQPIRRPIFTIEQPALEPTPLDYRVGRAARMFWLWFAATSSFVSLAIGAVLFELGMSVVQLLIAALLGVALSFLPLALGTLAGKWSGQPTMVVSRATFGVVGNVIPAVLALVTRLFWGAVLLWIAGSATESIAGLAHWPKPAGMWFAVGAGAAIVIAGVVAFFGYAFVARVQLILTIASALLTVGAVVYTWHSVDMTSAFAIPTENWLHVAAGAVIVFSFLGLAWANSSGDLARYQHPRSSGTASMLWAGFGAALAPFLLVVYGGLLAASHLTLASGLSTHPVATLIDAGLPTWYPGPLLAVIVVSLVSSIVLNIYSGGFALLAVGVRVPRQFAAAITAFVIALGAAFLYLGVSDIRSVLTELVTTLAVPVAAWAGIFSAEMMIRNRRFNPESLLRRGGVYADWRWVNLCALVVASVVGFGLLHNNIGWLHWQGFLYPLLSIGGSTDLAEANLGVPVALILGLLAPLIFGIPAIRRQEQARR